MDDILTWGSTEEEHNETLRTLLHQLTKAGLTLNKNKCLYNVQKLTFLGHQLDHNGIRPDEKKVEAILKMKRPTNKRELQIVLGMATYLARFVPDLSGVLQPLLSLLSKKQEFFGDFAQQQAFDKWKTILSSRPVPGVYDHGDDTVVGADASSFGLGALIWQRQTYGKFSVIAYASRLLSDTEKRNAQIEKEALPLVWACGKFKDYLVGRTLKLETDHKPLVPNLMLKTLDDLTLRLQRLKIRMMRYQYSVEYVLGKDLLAADTLSRAPLQQTGKTDLEKDVEAFVCSLNKAIPVKDRCLH